MKSSRGSIAGQMAVIALLSLSAACTSAPQGGNAPPGGDRARPEGGPVAVDIAIARFDSLNAPIEYVGTTRPFKEVSLRSQVEGRLLNLNADVGDRVTRGQTLARIDDSVLLTQVAQARAELATRESELARAKAQVSNAQTQLERARVEQQQAQNDAARYSQLARAGAVSQREAESFQTAARVANQAVLAAREQVRSQQQAVESASGQIAAQRAAVAQQEQRRAFASLISPLNGVVLEKISEPGNLISPGGEVLKLGDLSQLKIIIPVSELDLPTLRAGQSVEITLDAFPQEAFSGTVSRISPLADAATRQIPIEVTLPNPDARIGSGLLARGRFQNSQAQQRVVIPQTALQEAEGKGATVFVVEGQKVAARTVSAGDRAEGKVEIRSGLQPGERFVVNSSQPLKDGDAIRPSVLSEG